tara:strand:+ start:72 stop:1361 length:1290 start_codon:yes stop_codon:yes gene_type:complete
MEKQRLAVIGSGISGLSAAFFLSKKFNVSLFEKNNVLGGHTRTVSIFEKKKKILVDTGFIVFNKKNYQDFISFLNYLDVNSENSEMSFSVSDTRNNIEYGGGNINSLFSQRKNILSLQFIYFIFEILKLYRICKKLYSTKDLIDNISIEEFLKKNNFSKFVKDYHIYPMISSIWSSNSEKAKQFPLKSFIEFFSNHGLFNIISRPQWKYIKNGSNNYIEKLINKDMFSYETNFKIKSIKRENDKIKILSSNKIYSFDKLVLATHADQALSLIDKPTEDEQNLLSTFKYSKNLAVLHSDTTHMPQSKLTWSSWNFIKKSDSDNFSLTYWMNKLQNLPSKKNYFVTINPSKLPKNIIDQTIFEHPIFSLETLKAQKELYKIQGKKNTYFCGSYFGYGFHEDGIQSAASLCKYLDVDLPWKRNKNFISRVRN